MESWIDWLARVPRHARPAAAGAHAGGHHH